MKKLTSENWKKFLADAVPHFVLLIYLIVTTLGVFTGGIWSIVSIGGAILLFAAVWIADGHVPKPANDLAAMAVIALAVMALSNLHSSQPALSWFEWQRLGTIFLPLLVFSSPALQARAGNSRLFAIIPITTAACAFLLGFELSSMGVVLHALKSQATPLTQYNRGLSYLVILALPILAALFVKQVRCSPSPLAGEDRWGGTQHSLRSDLSLKTKASVTPPPLTPPARGGGLDRSRFYLSPQILLITLFISALFYAASLTESRAAKLALVVALAVTALAHVMPVMTRRILAVLPIIFIGWPFAAQKFFLSYNDWLKMFPDSWRARMEIWDYMSYHIMERPLLGWGLGVSHTLDFRDPHGAQYVLTNFPASHPHNAIIQLWVEMGLPGLALGIAFALLMLRKASRLGPALAPFALGAWAAALCLSLVAYSLWTDSLFAAFALTGFAFALLERRDASG